MNAIMTFEIQPADLDNFTKILMLRNLNVQGLRRIHICNLMQRLMRYYNFHSTEYLLENLNTNPDIIQVCREMLCLSTGEFFRDASLWIQLKSILKKFDAQQEIKILFSRTSTGEELYSLLIFLEEHGLRTKTSIHATEICNNVLQQTKKATYNIKALENAQKISQEIGFSKSLMEYFEFSGGAVTIKPYLIDNCTFFVQDIHTPVPDTQIQYDLIWYRNQLIYWDKPTANEHLTQLTNTLKSSGYLILGYAENLNIYSIMSNFETINFEDKIYKKK